jgi:pyruvate/2-oxoglutarate dehydrogenase complex dihydrolipoamide acyltransferase (E2) component
LSVKPGDVVEAGATVAVLEAMKMETPLVAPVAGRVREVFASVNSQVSAGAPVLRLEPDSDDAGPVSDAPTVVFAADADGESEPRRRATATLGALRALVTGYDVSAAQGRALVAEYSKVRRALPADDAELVAAELGLLTTFADICELSRSRPSGEEERSDLHVHSPREHLHSYLHSLDTEREGLPESFQHRLTRALTNYGITDLEPTAQLKEAVYRVFLALERGEAQMPVVTALLERWLEVADVATAHDALAEVLERLVAATQVRNPLISELARSVRYRYFEQPQSLAYRAKIIGAVREQLGYLAEHPDAPDRAERIEQVVVAQEPVIGLMSDLLSSRSADLHPLLEVLTRRYYRTRELEQLRLFQHASREFVTAEFDLGAARLHLITTVG